MIQPLSPQQSSQLQEGVRAGWGECPHLSDEDPDENRAQGPVSPVPLAPPSLPASFLSSGKFGAVCTCTEKATGLKLAAKVIKKQTPKDKVVGAGS